MNFELLDEKTRSNKNLTAAVYVLYALSFVLVVTAIVAIIINYVKKDDVAGTWLASHFKWQIRTFWYALLWFAIGSISLMFVVGFFVLLANAIWVIYRIVKGFIRLNDNLPMYI